VTLDDEAWPEITLDDGFHVRVWCCGGCGQGHLTEAAVQAHQAEVNADGDDHTGISYYVHRVALGSTLPWTPDVMDPIEPLRVEVKGFGRDDTGPWVALSGFGASSGFRYWVPAQNFVACCFPADDINRECWDDDVLVGPAVEN
jgi:hypothetical protein